MLRSNRLKSRRVSRMKRRRSGQRLLLLLTARMKRSPLGEEEAVSSRRRETASGAGSVCSWFKMCCSECQERQVPFLIPVCPLSASATTCHFVTVVVPSSTYHSPATTKQHKSPRWPVLPRPAVQRSAFPVWSPARSEDHPSPGCRFRQWPPGHRCVEFYSQCWWNQKSCQWFRRRRRQMRKLTHKERFISKRTQTFARPLSCS